MKLSLLCLFVALKSGHSEDFLGNGNPLYQKSEEYLSCVNCEPESLKIIGTQDDRALKPKKGKRPKNSKQKKGTSAPTSAPTLASVSTSIEVGLPTDASVEDFIPYFDEYATTLVGAASNQRALQVNEERVILKFINRQIIDCSRIRDFDEFCVLIGVVAEKSQHVNRIAAIEKIKAAINDGTAQQALRNTETKYSGLVLQLADESMYY